MWYYVNIDELYHHGIKGMKWGIRRYQNSDGSLTSAGRKRYGLSESSSSESNSNEMSEGRRARYIAAKPIADITNEELQEYTNRMNLENAYKKSKSKASTATKVITFIATAATVTENASKIYKNTSFLASEGKKFIDGNKK